MRRVAWVLVVYAVGAWVVLRAGVAVRRVLALPELFETLLSGLLAVGVPIAVAVAWRFPQVGDAGGRVGGEGTEEAP